MVNDEKVANIDVCFTGEQLKEGLKIRKGQEGLPQGDFEIKSMDPGAEKFASGCFPPAVEGGPARPTGSGLSQLECDDSSLEKGAL